MGASKRDFMELRESEQQTIRKSEEVFKKYFNAGHNAKHSNPLKDVDFLKSWRQFIRERDLELINACQEGILSLRTFDNEEEKQVFEQIKKQL